MIIILFGSTPDNFECIGHFWLSTNHFQISLDFCDRMSARILVEVKGLTPNGVFFEA